MTIRVVQGHAPDVLSQMPAESAHLVVTSPPYLWLRSYGTEPQVWPSPDGTPLCADGAHEWGETTRHARATGVASQSEKQNSNKGAMQIERAGVTGTLCARCGAWRGELGQEPTVERYIANLVSVFDAVRRVLRRDGLCWVNMSGSYFNNPGGQNGAQRALSATTQLHAKRQEAGRISAKAMEANRQAGRQDRIGAAGKDSWLKPLDWVDTPGLFAHAMQKRGWYWRADIALIKKSPLPESVQGWRFERCKVKVLSGVRSMQPAKAAAYAGTGQPQGGTLNGDAPGAQWTDCPGCSRCAPNDGLILRRGNGRPTRAWERFLVFAKAPGAYFDSEAVREPPTGRTASHRFWKKGHEEAARSQGLRQDGERVFTLTADVGRNLRDWQFWPTRGGVGGEAHYAAYPIPLAELAIRASTSERGVCPKCGAPWARVVERRFVPSPDVRDPAKLAKASIKGMPAENGWGETPRGTTESETTGWRPTCSCNAGAPVPAVVLDPFVGSGSTLLAAERLGRDAIGIDVQPQYIELAAQRARRDAPLFATVEVERQAEQAVVSSDGVPPLPQGPPPNGQTKQERHPDRGVAGFNQRWKATHAPDSESGAQLSPEAASKQRDLFSVLYETQEAE